MNRWLGEKEIQMAQIIFHVYSLMREMQIKTRETCLAGKNQKAP